MEILVRQDYTPKQINHARLSAVEFRPSGYTSGCANLDNMIALNKAVILCDTHARKFSPVKAHYRAHPAKNMRRVIGCCDVCKEYSLSHLFLNEKDAYAEQKKIEKFRRALEYSSICAA